MGYEETLGIVRRLSEHKLRQDPEGRWRRLQVEAAEAERADQAARWQAILEENDRVVEAAVQRSDERTEMALKRKYQGARIVRITFRGHGRRPGVEPMDQEQKAAG